MGSSEFSKPSNRSNLPLTFFFNSRSEFISDSEGFVQNITWSKQFVAWASDIGVRVYDVENKCSLGLMQWTKNPRAMPQNYRCNMSWLNGTTLLVRVSVIQPTKRNGQLIILFL